MADPATLPHNTTQPQVLAIAILFPAISTFIVALRVWSRVRMKQFASDDALALCAWALAVAYAGVQYKWVKVNHFGYHVWDLPTPNLHTEIFAAQLNVAQGMLYNPILCVVKASVILFLLRLGDKRKHIRWSLIVFFWFNLGQGISVFLVALMECLPINMTWDHYKTDRIVDGITVNNNYHCVDLEAFSLSTAGLTILTDILILMIPIAMVWNLRMPTRSKLAVGLVLSLGWVLTAVGIYRLKVFYDYWAGTSKDPTYGIAQFTISGIEVNVAIITSCGPALKALITTFSPRFFGTRSGSRTTRAAGHPYNAYPTRDGYELSAHRTPGKNSVNYTATALSTGPGRAQDDDGDSQKAIITNDSLGAKGDELGIRVERRVEISAAERGRSDESVREYGGYGRTV